MRWPLTGFWRQPDFAKLWSGQIISAVGSHVTGTALPLTAILVLAASPVQVGVLAALAALPVLLIGLVAGVWVDRLRRRPILIATDLGRAAVLALIPLFALTRALHIELLYAVAFSVGVLTVFSEIANQAYLPTVVPRENLVEANSAMGASESLAEIAGPPLGGVLVQWLTAPCAILFDAVSFLVSATCVAFIRAPEPPPKWLKQRESIIREIGEGLSIVVRHPLLRALALGSATFNFFGNFIGALYALFIIRDLRLSPAAVGLLVGLGGVGALGGALLAGRLVRRFGIGLTITGSLAITGLIQLLLPFAGGPTWLAISMLAASQLLGDVWIAIYFIGELSVRQNAIPDRLRGRANASMQVLMQGLTPVGAVVGGVLGAAIGVRITILIGVLGISLAALTLFLSPIRTLREVPVAPGV